MKRKGWETNTGCIVTNEDRATRQLKRFGWSMIALAISIGLYYLGFFGSTDGPLHPDRLSRTIVELGLRKEHILFFLFAVFMVSVTWNWIYNIFHRIPGKTRAGHQPIRKGVWAHTAWAAALLVMAGTFILLFC